MLVERSTFQVKNHYLLHVSTATRLTFKAKHLRLLKHERLEHSILQEILSSTMLVIADNVNL